jgi:hypothetical protein
MVVGPGGPGRGESHDQIRWKPGYWEWMKRKLHDAGIAAGPAELRALPHDVEIGSCLPRQLTRSS